MINPPPTQPGCDPNAQAAAGAALAEGCGYFVAASGNDTAAGTKEAPLATLGAAITLAQEKPKPIYACEGAFGEALVITAGVTIYGGLKCSDSSWLPAAGGKTTINADPPAIPVTFKKPSGKSHIERVAFVASDAKEPGGISLAAWIDTAEAEWVQCDFTAGAGADGAVGATPPQVGPSDPTDMMISGNPGAAKCMGGATGNLGGEAKTNALCPDSIGGTGGSGHEENGDTGLDGAPLPADNPLGLGLGGLGATLNVGCKAGQTGAVGEDGTPGAGGTGLGALSATGFVGVTGMSGVNGKSGGGGGGGGGAKGAVNCYGASGGGGGAGGCGGPGGQGGQAGGSSVGIVALSSDGMTFKDVTITTGAGGKGGDGGAGQSGSVGGAGGQAGGFGMAGAACAGGDGASGGLGGLGGGGVGGHSMGFMTLGKAPAKDGVTFKLGTAGNGGMGDPAIGAGGAGVSVDMQSFDPPK